MGTLGEQLVLLALDARKGAIRRSGALQFGLNAAGLADLVALRCITLTRPDGTFGITVAPDAVARVADDPILGAVAKTLWAAEEVARHPERCIRAWRTPSLHTYLKWLRQREVLTWDKPASRKASYGRFRLIDNDAAAAARARVDRVVAADGPDEQDLDLAGIVHGIGLGEVVYHGLGKRSEGRALAAAAARQRYAVMLDRVLPRPKQDDQKFTFDSSNDLKMASQLNAVQNGTTPWP